MNGSVASTVTVSGPDLDSRTTTSTVSTRTGPNAVAQTETSSFTQSPSALAGNLLVNLNGSVGGGIDITGRAGSATVNLAGRVGGTSSDGANVTASGIASQRDTVQSATGTSLFFAEQVTAFRSTGAETIVGGMATLNVAAGPALQAASGSSIEGDIKVQGRAGSTLTVAAGTRLNQAAGGLIVGATYFDTTSAMIGTFASGAQTGLTETSTATATGGVATVNNAGMIGSNGNRVNLQVGGIGGGSLVNTGTINGDITGTSRNTNSAAVTTITDPNDAALLRAVTATTLTAVGGSLGIDNGGLVTGEVSAVAAAGTVINSGVVRGTLTLGGGVDNATTTTTTTLTLMGPATVTAPSVANPVLFTQTYTLNQNGLLVGGARVTGTTVVDASGATVRTSNVNAVLNLNNGSVTLGAITAEAAAVANVNLNGSGFLGVATNDGTGSPLGSVVTGFHPTPSLARFTAIDPSLGTSTALPSGSRVSGVRTLAKTGDGTFVIVGAPLLAGVGTAAPTYTLDVGTLRVGGGELQLGLAGTTATSNRFGIRGDIENNASLVIGRRITDGIRTAIQGINVSVLGNVTNAATGSLIVGVNPAFVRGTVVAPGPDPFSGTPAPFVGFGTAPSGLFSTNSLVRVDGNLTLAGSVVVQGTAGGLYEAGTSYDLFNIGGTFTNTGTLSSSFALPFIRFALTPRVEGGRTIVSLGVARTDFAMIASDNNAAAAAGALQATLPSIFSSIRSGTGAAGAQDLATIVAALDTQLSADQAAQVFRELSSGEFYGSLSAVSTTIPFGEPTDATPPAGDSGIGLWFRPAGQFANYKGDVSAGASEIDVSNYGGSAGLNYATGKGGHFGIGGGYGALRVRSITPERADADTYMVGMYGVQQMGSLHLSAQAVYGWSRWNVSRTLSLLGRRATSEFDSSEMRGSVRAAYSVGIAAGFNLSPFARVEARRYSFNAFTEQGAGTVSLIVEKRSRTVISPEVGMRISSAANGTIRPFAEASYIFQGDVGSDRRVAFSGAAGQGFTVDGVDAGQSIKGAIGVAADVRGATVFLRGDYLTGGGQRIGSARGGLLFNF